MGGYGRFTSFPLLNQKDFNMIHENICTSSMICQMKNERVKWNERIILNEWYIRQHAAY